MLHSLLVPLDGSEFSERSLPLARRLAGATGASMHLAHVHVPYEPDHLLSNTQFHFEGLDLAEYDERHRENELRYLSGVVDRLEEDGPRVDSKLLEGPVVSGELAGYADEVEADMIFMTTHGQSGMSRLWMGSVTDAMIRKTAIPLFVIHPDHPGGVPADVTSVDHIMVPLDGSPLAEEILRPAKDISRATGARVTLVHIVATQAALGPRLFPLVPETLEPAMGHAEDYLERVASRLRDDGFDVSVHVAHADSPAVALADISTEIGADLIAIATHGYGGLRRTLVGSVADKILKTSPLPLLIMRPRQG